MRARISIEGIDVTRIAPIVMRIEIYARDNYALRVQRCGQTNHERTIAGDNTARDAGRR